jgi:hypothetical protein
MQNMHTATKYASNGLILATPVSMGKLKTSIFEKATNFKEPMT